MPCNAGVALVGCRHWGGCMPSLATAPTRENFLPPEGAASLKQRRAGAPRERARASPPSSLRCRPPAVKVDGKYWALYWLLHGFQRSDVAVVANKFQRRNRFCAQVVGRYHPNLHRNMQ